jgi:hypothetical protein
VLAKAHAQPRRDCKVTSPQDISSFIAVPVHAMMQIATLVWQPLLLLAAAAAAAAAAAVTADHQAPTCMHSS